VNRLDFLERLDLSAAERLTLHGLGVADALTLAHMIRASPEAFQRMIGDADRAERIEQQLQSVLSEEQRASLETTVPEFPLGARLETPPKLRDDG
jgi:hypothetical protein